LRGQQAHERLCDVAVVSTKVKPEPFTKKNAQ